MSDSEVKAVWIILEKLRSEVDALRNDLGDTRMRLSRLESGKFHNLPTETVDKPVQKNRKIPEKPPQY